MLVIVKPVVLHASDTSQLGEEVIVIPNASSFPGFSCSDLDIGVGDP
jgi:hypothetical protein